MRTYRIAFILVALLFAVAGWYIADAIGWHIVWIVKGQGSVDNGVDWVLKNMSASAEYVYDFLLRLIGALVGFGFASFMIGSGICGFLSNQRSEDAEGMEKHLIAKKDF